MADWFIATEGVKVVKEGASLWPQIITAVSSIGAALGGVGLTHHFTRKREERTASAKLESERLYISTGLVFCWSDLRSVAYMQHRMKVNVMMRPASLQTFRSPN